MSTITVGPVALDLKLYAGDGFALQFAFVDKSTGEPWPADGEWAAQVRAPITNDDPLVAFTIDQSQALDGKVTISLTGDEVRSLLGVDEAGWDLQQTAPGAQARTWYRGKVTVTQDVTR
jgi:hypothetical protein